MSNRRHRFDLIPAVLTLAFVGLAGWIALRPNLHPQPPPIERPVLSDEAAEFREKYGKAQFSSHDEELFVRDFFQDKRGGVFVDIGASDARERSNTYFLEKDLGWSGIAVDPIQEFASGYEQYRPRTKFLPLFVSNKSDATATLYVGTNTLFSSADRAFTDSFTGIKRQIESPTITLTDLLTAQKIETFDF